MLRWIIGITIVIFIGCTSIKPIVPTSEELNIPEDFNNYTFIESENSPFHVIQISIHVIQDSIGRGNFTIADSVGNLLHEGHWLVGLVDDANKRMADLQPMQMPTSSRYIKDSRIRYQVVGVYDWQNQSLFDLSKVYPSTGDQMYQYIMQQDEVTHKENSLHLFFAGSINKDNGRIASRGIASGLPDKKWTVLFNYYSKYKSTKNYWPASLISHEIGHNLGLSHTWNRQDGCDDTPRKSRQCWALNEPKIQECDELVECSNNLMDYNAWQNALTECQLSKIHYNIKNNLGSLQDIIRTENDDSSNLIGEISGDNIIDSTATFVLNGIPPGQSVKWYVTPREAVENAIGSGTKATIIPNIEYSGKALITFHYPGKSDDLSLEKRFKINKK